MPDWSDPLEIQRDTEVFVKILILLLGLYTWEVLGSLRFEWQVISGKKKFTWLMVVYFLCKYSLLMCLIVVNIATGVSTEVNCGALYTFSQIAGNTAIGTTSALLMFRTFAIWSTKKYIVIPLCVLFLGQWALLLHGYTIVKSSWSPEAMACVVYTKPEIIKAIYVYTMLFDLTVLLLSIAGLLLSPARSGLWGLLFTDGVIYFIASFTAYLFPVVFAYLNLNPAMNIICPVPASVCSGIVACRLFVRLSDRVHADVYIPEALVGPSEAKGRINHNCSTSTPIVVDIHIRHSAKGSESYTSDVDDEHF
ncbi:hypothetical protein BOTBODRAFT_36610 [Botryobasidium botryosum FD-172 SS1]|uniref:Integral membrane protein n=1 Tax=Botryobasidium botryosum (strain FD-172 SS1) TaxID=930990 RepID=A0A067MEI4_BOTB1|nr:hypothetical protein BOTBODRAFT_36610 [Botryobasidium botryosum FD-172 SS1]